MKWTTKTPTVDGWYWRKLKGGMPYIIGLRFTPAETHIYTMHGKQDQCMMKYEGTEWCKIEEPT